jgi:hypothetical protein
MQFVCILLFAGLLTLLGLHTPVYAQSTPTYLEDITTSPGPMPEPIKREPQVAGLAEYNFAHKFATAFDEFFGDVRGISHQQLYRIFTIDVREDAEPIELGAVGMVSKALQKACLKLITYQHTMSANHVQCFKDEDGSNRHPPTERIFSPTAYGSNKLLVGSEIWNTITSIGNLTCEDFNFYNSRPNQVVRPDNGLECGRQEENLSPVDRFFLDGDKDQGYPEEADPYLATAEERCSEAQLEESMQCQQENKNRPPDQQEDCSLTCNVNGVQVYSTLWSWGERIAEILGRGEDGECNGFTCAFIPKAFNLTKTHGTKTNGQDHTISLSLYTGDVTTEKPAYYYLAHEEEHVSAMNCGNMPKALRLTNAPEKTCEFNTLTSGAMPPEPVTSNVDTPPAPSCENGSSQNEFPIKTGSLDAAITKATAGKIPKCVLQGVANIEGAAIEIASGKCSPNQCGAMGPFQITVGFTFSGSGASCQKDTTCAACGLSSCPNAIKYYVPGTNPCDTESAAKAAVSMLIGKSAYFGKPLDMTGDKDAIIVAGDSYYGAPVPIQRFGGCSYGEWIYKDACGHPEYVCAAHEFPTRQSNPP